MKKTNKNETLLSDEQLKVHPALRVFFGYNLYKAGIHYKALIDKSSSKYNLTAPHCGILYILSTGDQVNQLTLGLELGIDKATMVKHIDFLESLKLVKRAVDPNDRRAKFVALTEKGKKAVSEVRADRARQEEELMNQFSKLEQENLRKLIPELLEAIMRLEDRLDQEKK